MKNYSILLTLLIITLSCNTNSEKDAIIPEKFDCDNGKMESAWYTGGNDETVPAIKNLKDDFIILVDTNLKAKNFISFNESYYRGQSETLDTSDLNWMDGWEKLTVKQKFEIVKEKRISSKQRADSIHSDNNDKKSQQVWIINNTKTPVEIQMQDWSYICVLQAKTKKGQWMPIEYWQFSDCGNSYHAKTMQPKSVNSFITKLPNRGEYKTKLRYKLLGTDKFYYSNEFDGKINYCEFVEDKKNYREINGEMRPHFKLDSLINIVHPPLPPLKE